MVAFPPGIRWGVWNDRREIGVCPMLLVTTPCPAMPHRSACRTRLVCSVSVRRCAQAGVNSAEWASAVFPYSGCGDGPANPKGSQVKGRAAVGEGVNRIARALGGTVRVLGDQRAEHWTGFEPRAARTNGHVVSGDIGTSEEWIGVRDRPVVVGDMDNGVVELNARGALSEALQQDFAALFQLAGVDITLWIPLKRDMVIGKHCADFEDVGVGSQVEAAGQVRHGRQWTGILPGGL